MIDTKTIEKKIKEKIYKSKMLLIIMGVLQKRGIPRKNDKVRDF